MNCMEISNGIGGIDDRHIREAAEYRPAKRGGFFGTKYRRAAVAAVLALCVLVGIFAPDGGVVVSAYAYGGEEALTEAGSVMSTGTISDSGEMKGHPLMFYLVGERIERVRFSCKNQQICFMDWTETRDEFGNAQNFTVSYGADASEYYYLLIDWVPTATIRALTNHTETRIATLPETQREDIIVMEITFTDGTSATKAITISLQDDGTFFAAFGDYEISDADTFVHRADAPAIPRELLYGAI